MQILWPRKKDMTTQGVVLTAIGIADIVIALVFGSNLHTSTRVNSAIFGVLVVFLALGLLRSRVIVSDDQLVVRNMWRTHTMPWSKVTGIIVASRQVTVVKLDGSTLTCMALSPRLERPEAAAAVDTIKSHITPVE